MIGIMFLMISFNFAIQRRIEQHLLSFKIQYNMNKDKAILYESQI